MYKIKIAHYNPTLFTAWVKNQHCLLTDLAEKPGTLLHRQMFSRIFFPSQMRSPVSPFLRYFLMKDFPSGPMIKTTFQCRWRRFDPLSGNILYAAGEKRKMVAVKQFSSLRGQIQIIGKTPRARILCIITQAETSVETPK